MYLTFEKLSYRQIKSFFLQYDPTDVDEEYDLTRRLVTAMAEAPVPERDEDTHPCDIFFKPKKKNGGNVEGDGTPPESMAIPGTDSLTVTTTTKIKQ